MAASPAAHAFTLSPAPPELDWDFEVADGAFRDTEGRRGLVFGVTPTKVLSFGKGEPYSQTRYRFTT